MKNIRNYSTLPLTVITAKGRSIDHNIRIKKKHYRQYFNAQHIYFHLNNVERSFFEFLVENTDSSSRVLVDTNMKKGYLCFMEKILGGQHVSLNLYNIEKAVQKLKSKFLIVPVIGNRGLYYINPKYVHVGTETSRLETLDKIITERQLKNQPINMLLDVPDEKLDSK